MNFMTAKGHLHQAMTWRLRGNDLQMVFLKKEIYCFVAWTTWKKVEKKYNLTASKAYAKAKKKYNWEQAIYDLFDLFGEEDEPDGLL